MNRLSESKTRATALAAGLALVALLGSTTQGHEPTRLRTLPATAFSPVRVPESAPTATPEPPYADFPATAGTDATRRPKPAPRASARAVAKPTRAPATTKLTPKPLATRHSITGKASWYCKAGVSVCHHSYPDRRGVVDLYAAACGKLRSAMGGGWRGDRVRVTRLDTGRSVVVRLIDWCGSSDKTIDLYWDAMHALGGSGVIRVKVSW